jgi:hypothetical protein
LELKVSVLPGAPAAAPEVRAKWATKTREARGYGAAPRTLRAQYARLVEAGEAVCIRCHRPIPPGELRPRILADGD